MHTSSFDKEYKLDTKESVESLIGALTNPPKSIQIDRTVTESEVVERGFQKLKNSSSEVKK